MTGRWFRFFDTEMNDPRVRALPAPLFRFWVDLLCLASQRDGDLGTVADIALATRCRLDHTLNAVSRLNQAQLIDCINSRYTPRAWHTRQWKSDQSNQRTRDWRLRQKQRSPAGESPGPVTVTVTGQNRSEDKNLSSPPHARSVAPKARAF
jgi:hypothetical protein